MLNLYCGDHFSYTVRLDQSVEQKEIMEWSKLPGILACAVILPMGGLAFKNPTLTSTKVQKYWLNYKIYITKLIFYI